MRICLPKFVGGVALCSLFIGFIPLSHAQSDDATLKRMQALEARLAELESRLVEAEQETQEVKEIAETSVAESSASRNGIQSSTLNILAGSTWRDLRWTEESQWVSIRKGMTEEQVVRFLGSPPRSVKSAKPRVDEVFYYETSIRDTVNSVRGQISFRKGKVVAYTKPDFEKARTLR